MVDCMALLKPDAMTGHWEFTLGATRVKEIIGQLGFPFLAQNVRDTEWDEPAFDAMRMIERGGVKIAVIGQALPYTAIANPRWMIPNWSFGIRENDLRANVEKARKQGAELVVLLSHNGFDVDHKLAGRVNGIDVILTAHTHDACRTSSRSARPCSSPPEATASSCRGSISTSATARSRTIASSSSRCSPT
jgi:sulfur-oxidizing protein SoxB